MMSHALQECLQAGRWQSRSMLFTQQHEEEESIVLLGFQIMSAVQMYLTPKEYLCTGFQQIQRLGRNGQNLLGNVDEISRRLIHLFVLKAFPAHLLHEKTTYHTGWYGSFNNANKYSCRTQ